MDLPSYVITYARDPPFLALNALNVLPTLVANFIVITYFIARSITFQACDICRVHFLQVSDIEETYVRRLWNGQTVKTKVYKWVLGSNSMILKLLFFSSVRQPLCIGWYWLEPYASFVLGAI